MPKTEEQFRQMRDDMRSRILRESSLYFAKNGFGDTKISDLAKHIGIGQGTIYLYFKSKEELFEEIRKNADNTNEVKLIKALAKLPLSAATKIERISAEVIKKLEDEEYAVKITIYTQLLLEQDSGLYKSEMYEALHQKGTEGRQAGEGGSPDACGSLLGNGLSLCFEEAVHKGFQDDRQVNSLSSSGGMIWQGSR